MKKITFVLLLVLCALSVFSQESSFDFRKAKWGMTLSEVQKSEGRTLTQSRDGIFYRTDSLFGQKAQVIFYFNDDGVLYAGEYFFSTFVNSVYNAIFSELKQKYGEYSYDSSEETLSRDVTWVEKIYSWRSKNTLVQLVDGDIPKSRMPSRTLRIVYSYSIPSGKL